MTVSSRTARQVRTERRRADLRVVRGRRGRSLRSLLIPAAVVLILAVFGVAAIEAYLSQEGFRAAKLENALRKADEQHELLRAEVARLSSPSRVQEQAAKAGMQAPPDPVFLRVPVRSDGAASPLQAVPQIPKRTGTGEP